jgi:hypothetical protein
VEPAQQQAPHARQTVAAGATPDESGRGSCAHRSAVAAGVGESIGPMNAATTGKTAVMTSMATEQHTEQHTVLWRKARAICQSVVVSVILVGETQGRRLNN